MLFKLHSSFRSSYVILFISTPLPPPCPTPKRNRNRENNYNKDRAIVKSLMWPISIKSLALEKKRTLQKSHRGQLVTTTIPGVDPVRIYVRLPGLFSPSEIIRMLLEVNLQLYFCVIHTFSLKEKAMISSSFDWNISGMEMHGDTPPPLTHPPFGAVSMGSTVRVRSAGQKYGPTCHQRDRADVTEFVTLVRLSSRGQHVGVLALARYKRRKSALTAGPNWPHSPFSNSWIHSRTSIGHDGRPGDRCL